VIVKSQALELHLAVTNEAPAKTGRPSINDPAAQQLPTVITLTWSCRSFAAVTALTATRTVSQKKLDEQFASKKVGDYTELAQKSWASSDVAPISYPIGIGVGVSPINGSRPGWWCRRPPGQRIDMAMLDVATILMTSHLTGYLPSISQSRRGVCAVTRVRLGLQGPAVDRAEAFGTLSRCEDQTALIDAIVPFVPSASRITVAAASGIPANQKTLPFTSVRGFIWGSWL
jgi:hypothetical protein